MPRDRADEADQHLSQCDRCRKLLDGLVDGELERELREMGREHVGEESTGVAATVAMERPPSVSAGQTIQGSFDIPDYRPLKLIGEGGFGQVWLVEQKLTGVLYALKTLAKTKISSMELDGIRAHKERVTEHQHIISIEHVGETDSCFYYVMELADDARGAGTYSLEGYQTLALDEMIKRTAPFQVDDAMDILSQVLEGLAHLHSIGLLHRDVKPANVVRRDGHWKLADMGLAARVTDKRMRGGTPAYSPPGGVGDRGGDLYSVGVMFAEMLSGSKPKPGRHPVELLPPYTRSSMPKIASIIEQACAEDHDDRIQSARRMLDALVEIQSARHAKIEAPLQQVSEQPIPSLLPFLTNRREQDHALHEALRGFASSASRRPLICVVHGDEYQSQDMFLERLRLVTLPRLLRLDSKERQIRDYLLKWPENAANGPSVQERLRMNLAEEVLDDPDASKNELVSALSRERIPVVIHTHLLSLDWRRGGSNILPSFLEFWSDWPDIPRSTHVVVCLFVKYLGGKTGGRLKRWFGPQRLNNQIRRALAGFEFDRWPTVHAVVLPELLGILRKDVEDWARSEAREFAGHRDLLSEIRNLYDRVALKSPDGRIPMEQLSRELARCLGAHA